MRPHHDARLCNDSHERAPGLLTILMQPFCVLHRIAWSAPWTEQRR
jgi:hypothetical protein